LKNLIDLGGGGGREEEENVLEQKDTKIWTQSKLRNFTDCWRDGAVQTNPTEVAGYTKEENEVTQELYITNT
jgi:hypothetical protein